MRVRAGPCNGGDNELFTLQSDGRITSNQAGTQNFALTVCVL